MNPGRLKKLEALWPWAPQMMETLTVELGYMTYLERPDYLMETSEVVEYEYDNNGNRTKMVTDQGSMSYTYDENNRLISDGTRIYEYDPNGNMVRSSVEEESIEYNYTPSNKLESINYPDTTYVRYGYDAFGRKVTREEGYWKLNENEAKNNSNGKGKSNSGQQNKPSKVNQNKQNNGKAVGKATAYGQLKKAETINPLKMNNVTQQYVYDRFSINVMKEYTGHGSPVGQNYLANDTVASRKMFGLKGALVPGREPKLDTNGGLMYFQYDGLNNVTAMTNRHGETIEEYRYDAFGNLFTGITAPYNTSGFVGKHYDVKAGMIDNHARWYAPDLGRFLTADSYRGEIEKPYTQNRYAYVGNNPVNRWDPLGYWESLATSPSGTYHPDGSFTPKDPGNSGGSSGGSSGGGGSNNHHEPTPLEKYLENMSYINSKAGELPSSVFKEIKRATSHMANSFGSVTERMMNLERYSTNVASILSGCFDGLETVKEDSTPVTFPKTKNVDQSTITIEEDYIPFGSPKTQNVDKFDTDYTMYGKGTREDRIYAARIRAYYFNKYVNTEENRETLDAIAFVSMQPELIAYSQYMAAQASMMAEFKAAGAFDDLVSVIDNSAHSAVQNQKLNADLLRQELSGRPSAQNSKLNRIIDKLYKGQGNPKHVGNGTTMDAVRNEILTGKPTNGIWHIQKGEESITSLNNLLNSSQKLSPNDINTANKILTDLINAFDGR